MPRRSFASRGHSFFTTSTSCRGSTFGPWWRATRKAGEETGPKVLASLAVQDRSARRALVFDDLGLLGWENRGTEGSPDRSQWVRDPVGTFKRMAFTGIHVVERAVFSEGSRSGTFSIISLYLDLAAEGWVIRPEDVTDADWLDVGTPQRLAEARRRFG